MGTFNEIIRLVGANFIKGMFVSMLVIIFCRKIFKNKLNTENAIGIIRWLMIGYSTLILVHFLLQALLPSSSSSFLERTTTGPYKFAFWLMALGAVSPLILFFKKLGNKVYFILVLTIFMNIGWLMESLVIHVSIMEREYSPKFGGFKAFLPFEVELIIILQGIILGVLLIVIGNLSFFRKNAIE
jgi:hypothetical protein